MTTELQIIDQRTVLGKEFRVFGDFENPLFLAKDVAELIEHSNSRTMLDPVDEDEKGVRIIYTLGGPQEMQVLTEDGFYEVLFLSRKPIAKQFKREAKRILKELRVKGMSNMIPASSFHRLQYENNKLAVENIHLRKRQSAMQRAKGCIYLSDVAIQLFHQGIGNGNENDLVTKMVKNGLLQKDQSSKRRWLVRPYLKDIRSGYFTHRLDLDDQPIPLVQSKILVTPKGFDWICEEFNKIDNREYDSDHALLGYVQQRMGFFLPPEAGGPVTVTDELGRELTYR